MLPLLTWLLYALPAYILWPIVFRLRFGHHAWIEPLVPRTAYQWTDFGLGLALCTYTVWLAYPWLRAGAPNQPIFNSISTAQAVGLIAWGLGCAMRIWAVGTLGPNWRIGQVDSDPRHQFVARGPYRFYKHPINLALIIVAAGQAFLTGLNFRALFLLAAAITYAASQNAREDRYWRGRVGSGQSDPASPS